MINRCIILTLLTCCVLPMSNFAATCRQTVQELVHNDVSVGEQLDAFIQALYQQPSLTDKDRERILEGVIFAAHKHRFQTRKNPQQTPYIIHPIGVAYNLMTIGQVSDPDTILGGLLHDTVEDTDTSLKELEERFGMTVASLVAEVTDDKSLPKETRKQLQIEHASHKSTGAAQIKLADKLYNLTDLLNSPPADWPQERIAGYFRWAQAVVDNLPQVNAPLKQAVDAAIQSYWDIKSQ